MKRSDFLNDLAERGLIYQTTDLEGLKAELDSHPNPAAYVGFDCTARSLHVGNLMQIMMLRLLQKYSIKPIAILGGATSKIGDPSGRDTARDMMTVDTIQNNMAGIKKSLQKFVKFGDEKDSALLVNNSDWLESLSYIDLLRNYGTYFSINKMLTAEKIKLRLEQQQNLSFLEFNYPILQAYDFLHLNEKHGCILQFGGSDQWGNIVMGTELIRKVTGKPVFGVTTPLITTASGAKMGKSQSGALWLNEDMVTPYDYYQFWRNTDDRDVFKFMLIYTDILVRQVEQYRTSTDSINEFKKLLAFEATKLCHGETEAHSAAEAATKMFEQSDDSANLPEFKLNASRVKAGVSVCEALKEFGMVDSLGEAKRLIKGGGAKLNKAVITDETLRLHESDFTSGYALLSVGKKKYFKVSIDYRQT